MKKGIFSITVFLCLILFTAPGFGQPPYDSGRRPSKEQTERVKDRIETLKMWKLTNALDLNEETAAKLFPLIKEYDKKRMSVMKELGEDMQELRKSADIPAGDDELNQIIKKLKDNNRKLQDINDEEIKKLSDILTVRQMAKYLVFKNDFNTEMRKIITEAKQKRGMGQKDRPMMPADEEAPERP